MPPRYNPTTWGGDGAVERARLENELGLKTHVGSNPTLPANRLKTVRSAGFRLRMHLSQRVHPVFPRKRTGVRYNWAQKCAYVCTVKVQAVNGLAVMFLRQAPRGRSYFPRRFPRT